MSKLDEINGRVKQGGVNPAIKEKVVKPNDSVPKDKVEKRPLWKRDWKK